MGCGGSKPKRTRKNRRSKKGSAKKGVEDIFLDTNFYCPTTELSDGGTLAHGTKDDDIAFLERECDPSKCNYYHFQVESSAHFDFAIGVSQVRPINNAIHDRDGDAEDDDEPAEDPPEDGEDAEGGIDSDDEFEKQVEVE